MRVKWYCPNCKWANWTKVQLPLRAGSEVQCRNEGCQHHEFYIPTEAVIHE